MTSEHRKRVYRDSSMFIGSIVEQTTSWLTINPHKGCPLKCAYCFRAKWHPAETPTLETSVDEAVRSLLEHPDFVPGLTPVSVNISSTDSLLPTVRQSTFEALALLEANKLKNPFGITTKLELTGAEIQYLQSLQYVRPIVLVSLALIPRHIEPVSIAARIRNLKALAGTSIPTIHYYRPIVAGWNDSADTIEKALALGDRYAGAICIGGLRVSPEIRSELRKNKVDMPERGEDFHVKVLPAGFEAKLWFQHHRMGATVPVFKHTFCAVQYLLGSSCCVGCYDACCGCQSLPGEAKDGARAVGNRS